MEQEVVTNNNQTSVENCTMENGQKEEKQPATACITNCSFTGVHWDKSAVEAVAMVAKGLLNLTELFANQNVKIGSLVRVDANGTSINEPEAE